jgi:hypothetical protein
MKRFISILFVLYFITAVKAQQIYPQDYFRSPIDFRILLSGTFGELRSNHFHTGIDIKTRGVEGASVYATADGYVSRVKISAFGYGKTIYLTHPNGYVSVYGHLSALEDSLAAYVKKAQYKRKSFEVDLYPQKDQFKYSKSDVIALSGNSGGSGGPHLHFEIRDEKTQEPLNPLLFGIEVKDYIRPTINSIRVYPIGYSPFNLELRGWGENYRLKTGDTLALPKEFYMGINTIDKQNDSKNNNGVFEVSLFVDSTQVYGNRQERLNFSTGRYINTFIDYGYYFKYKRRYQRAFVGKQNKLKLYSVVQNNGLIHLSDTSYHQIVYQVKDANGNSSKLKFYAFIDDSIAFKSLPLDTLQKVVFYADKENTFATENLQLALPRDALYDRLNFHFDVSEMDNQSYSPIYQLHQGDVPLHKYIQLRIRADSISEKLKKKVLIARVEDDNFITSTTKWDGDWAKASIRSFGKYTLVADTVMPTIKWLNSSKSVAFKAGSKLTFKIKDAMSGIKTYKGFLNGDWVLFEYDAKNNLIFYVVEENRLLDDNKMIIEVEDRVGNKKVWERTLKKP